MTQLVSIDVNKLVQLLQCRPKHFIIVGQGAQRQDEPGVLSRCTTEEASKAAFQKTAEKRRLAATLDMLLDEHRAEQTNHVTEQAQQAEQVAVKEPSEEQYEAVQDQQAEQVAVEEPSEEQWTRVGSAAAEERLAALVGTSSPDAEHQTEEQQDCEGETEPETTDGKAPCVAADSGKLTWQCPLPPPSPAKVVLLAKALDDEAAFQEFMELAETEMAWREAEQAQARAKYTAAASSFAKTEVSLWAKSEADEDHSASERNRGGSCKQKQWWADIDDTPAQEAARRETCRYFAKCGWCKHGSACWYQHSTSKSWQIPSQPSTTSGAAMKRKAGVVSSKWRAVRGRNAYRGIHAPEWQPVPFWPRSE